MLSCIIRYQGKELEAVFGYVRCDDGEMLVKHQRLYGAVYCGLCHSVRKIGARFLLPYFNYDFVFLALVRMLICEEKMELERDFCPFHPFRRKRQRLSHNPTLAYTAYVALALTAEKMKDDLFDPDSSFFRRIAVRFALPGLRWEQRRIEKKNPRYRDLSAFLAENLSEGRAAEKRGAGLDEMASSFSSCMARLFSFGTEGKKARLLEGMGDKLGRFLYTLDALDDLPRDRETGAFNPLLSNGNLPDRETLMRLDMVLSFYIEEMKKILDLTDGDPSLTALCEHIVCRGLPAATKKILKPDDGEK